MKTENYVKGKSQNSLRTITDDVTEKRLDVHDLQKCRNMLEKDGEKYTDKQIEIIYFFLKEMVELSISVLQKK